jgi:hypothetical protein
MIQPPKTQPEDPDHLDEAEMVLEPALEQLIADMVERGWDRQTAIEAVLRVAHANLARGASSQGSQH